MAVDYQDKIKVVPIDKVVPNTWNPKEKNHKKLADIMRSIEMYGFKQPVQVRQHPNLKGSYEIIDGEQRWTALQNLGASQVAIYDNGVVSDEDAQNETLWWQVQVPFDEIPLAKLVASLDELNLELPYTEDELKTFKEMAGFDFANYEKERPEDEEDDGFKTVLVKVTEPQYNIIMQALDKAIQLDPDNISQARALELISADYLAS